MTANCLRNTYSPAVNISFYSLSTTAHYLAADLFVVTGQCDQTERKGLTNVI